MRLTTAAEHTGRTCLVTPDDAAGEEIRQFELQGLTGQTAKSLIWRYVFAVQAARYLVRHVNLVHGNRFAAPIRALKRFLQKNSEADEESFYDRVMRGGRGLQTSLSLEAFGVKANLDRKGGSEGARASRQLAVLESGVARAFTALRCAGKHPPLLVLVDQLEQVWSSDPDSSLKRLPVADALELLMAVVPRARDATVQQRLITETRGNPFGLIEFARQLSDEQLDGRVALPDPLILDLGLERAVMQRISGLPAGTRSFLLLAAADPTGDRALVERAAASMDINPVDIARAHAPGLLDDDGRLVFSHPLLRSALTCITGGCPWDVGCR
jgi:hypothetical protein